jgi:hypothetical protein
LHKGGSECPSIAGAGPYAGLADVPTDPAAKQRIQLLVIERCNELYQNCRQLAPGLSISEFEGLVNAAHALNVWSYRNLPPEFLPYVLVLCGGRFEKSAYRKTAFFFMLSLKQRVDALWIHATPAMYILRVAIPTGETRLIPITNERLLTPDWVSGIQANFRARFGLM